MAQTPTNPNVNGHAASSRHGRLVGIGLLVGLTSCCASPIGLLAEGFNALVVVTIEPVPWRDTITMLPLTLSVLSIAVLLGLVLGLIACSSIERRLKLARRLHELVILTGLGLLGWSATTLVFLLPFIDANTGLTGLAQSTETTVVVAASSITVLLALVGVGLIILSARVADVLSDRVFGRSSRICWTCGYPLGLEACPECGSIARGRSFTKPRRS
ncbi:MAG: hypothetical protein AB8G96_16295 [Phycisphaerales bacterium]